MCNISRITSANRTPEKTIAQLQLTIAQICSKLYGPAEDRRRASRSALELEMSSCSFWKRNSPSTGICLGILCSLLQVIAVMYQTLIYYLQVALMQDLRIYD